MCDKINLDEVINKVICGDALEVLKSFPDNCIDLVITSPPYYNLRVYDAVGIGCEKTLDEYLENLLNIFSQCVRITKETGSIVFNLGDKYEDRSLLLIPYRFAIKALERENVKLINEVTWVKLNPVPTQDQRKLEPSTEPFFIFAKSKDYYFNRKAFLSFKDKIRKARKSGSRIGQSYFKLIEISDLTEEQKAEAKRKLKEAIREAKEGLIESFTVTIRGIHKPPFGNLDGGRQSNLDKNGFTIIKRKGNAMKGDVILCPVATIQKVEHPAVYPEFIVQEFLKLLTKENDIVLDPFIGSGTTGIVAKRMKRRFIGIDISPKYCKIAEERIANTKEDEPEIIVSQF